MPAAGEMREKVAHFEEMWEEYEREYRILEREFSEGKVEEMQEILSQMELIDPQRTRPIKNEFKILLKRLKKDERSALLGPERQNLLQDTDKLQQSSRRLEDAHRIALETEQTAINTLGDLSRQRQQLERQRDTLNETDSWLAKSQGLLLKMQSKLVQNKYLSWGIACLLVVLILVIIIAKVF